MAVNRLTFLALALWLMGCSGIKPGQGTPETTALVKVEPLVLGSLAREIGADGQVKADLQATVTSASSGRVVRVQGKVGQPVHAGDPLVWIEDPLAPSNIRRLTAQVEGARAQLTTAQVNTEQSAGQKRADVAQAEANVKLAQIGVQKAQAALDANQTELNREEDLLTKKALAKTDVEKARLSRDQARADLRTAGVQLSAAREKLRATQANLSVSIQRSQEGQALASLRQAEADLESALAQQTQDIVRSPISGLIAERNVEVGQNPSTLSQPMMLITDPTKLRVEARFDERYSERVKRGQRAEGRSVTNPTKTIPLIVEQITPETKQALIAVVLRVSSEKRVPLVPNEYVRVRLVLDDSKGILIPTNAVIWGESGDASVMIAEDGKAIKRSIVVADQDERQVLVTKGDLKAGQLLIVEGQTGLRQGALVRYQK